MRDRGSRKLFHMFKFNWITVTVFIVLACLLFSTRVVFFFDFIFIILMAALLFFIFFKFNIKTKFLLFLLLLVSLVIYFYYPKTKKICSPMPDGIECQTFKCENGIPYYDFKTNTFKFFGCES